MHRSLHQSVHRDAPVRDTHFVHIIMYVILTFRNKVEDSIRIENPCVWHFLDIANEASSMKESMKGYSPAFTNTGYVLHMIHTGDLIRLFERYRQILRNSHIPSP